MATRHGKDLVFKIDNAAAALQQITGVSDVQGLPGAYATDDVTAAGDTGAKTVVGLPDQTFTVSGPYDDTATTGSHTVFNGLPGLAATQSVEYYPAGTTAGYPKYTCEVRVTDYTVDASVKAALKWKATCHVEGKVTAGTA